MNKNAFLRYASPTEQRPISREDLSMYQTVIIGAIYEFSNGLNLHSPQSFYAPLKRCIEEHTFLNVVIADRHTDKPSYQRVPTINLDDHITILEGARSEQWKAIQDVLQQNLDVAFEHKNPPWRIIVLPLNQAKCFIAFAFSHSILDGTSALSFHRTFVSGLSLQSPTDPIINTSPTLTLHSPLDDRLSVTLSYLLSPLLSALFNLESANTSLTTPQTWTGTPTFFTPPNPNSQILLQYIPPSLLTPALSACRTNNCKLTSLLHLLFIRALSKHLSLNQEFTSLVALTAVNLRSAADVPETEMGEYVSGVYTSDPIICGPVNNEISREEWRKAQEYTSSFQEAKSRLKNQPIGLLRYAPGGVRKWVASQVRGKRREASYGISNIGLFKDTRGQGAKIEEMVFAQPGAVGGAPLSINVVSVKDGGLVYTVTWPRGAIGSVAEGDEARWVQRVCESVKDDLDEIGNEA
ncbi:alcohol acetyltransferase [Cladorrhinum sp. PSN332]|nr:alcohol acetyltransferase [Cladorrhinum sp. PSN332]